MSTPESEYRRVVRHETGHTLGFPHEHMRKELVARLDPQKCYIYYRRFGWDKRMVDCAGTNAHLWNGYFRNRSR